MAKKSELVLFHDVKLTRKAREIFGSNVIKAFTAQHNYDWSSKEEQLKELKESAKEALDGKEISLDSKMIVIQFENNRMVRFNSSEWGAIAVLTDSFEEIAE